VTVGEIHGNRNPFPAFLGDGLGLCCELFGDKTIKQSDVLQPTAIIMLKEVALDGTARLFVASNSNEASTTIRCADSMFRQRSANLLGLIITRATGILPDLLCRARDYAEQSPYHTD